MTRRLLRGAALAIAIAGAIDPAITARRAVKPRVSLVGSPALPDPTLVDRVASSLASSFRVTRETSGGPAAAVISVGEQLPGVDDLRSSIAFAVLPQPRQPYVAIETMSAPERAHLEARVLVNARVRVVSGEGRKLTVALRKDGVEVDRVTHDVTGTSVVTPVLFNFVATASGATRVAVVAEVEGARRPATAELVVHAGRERWAVLAYDLRPSWASTFVRRALEIDPRFVVTSRVRTTPSQAATAGTPPPSLATPALLDAFQVVLVGAAQELTDADVAGLEAFMRQHGGAAILLVDEPQSAHGSRALGRLTGVEAWTSRLGAEPVGNPPASEFTWPTRMPSWAEAIVAAPRAAARQDAPPAIWRMPVGRGLLIVNGALDGWRYRHVADAYDTFWVTAVAEAAGRSADGADRTPRAILPDAGDLAKPAPDERALVAAWTASRRGRAIPESELESLGPELERTLVPPREPYTFHPMRSPWWILPFGAVVGIEWLSRRRGGLK
jgi:hypothetical protein